MWYTIKLLIGHLDDSNKTQEIREIFGIYDY